MCVISVFMLIKFINVMSVGCFIQPFPLKNSPLAIDLSCARTKAVHKAFTQSVLMKTF